MTDRHGRHHLVIGDGVSAGAFAATAPLAPGDRLTLLAPAADRIGRGLAYGDHPDDAPWRYAYLLNQPAIDIDPEFPAWLRPRWAGIRAAMAGRRPDWLAAAAPFGDDIDQLFLPRAIHGDYLQDRVEAGLSALAARGVTVTRLTLRATALDAGGRGFRVTLEDGFVLDAESVDVATGGPLPQRFPGDHAAPCLAGPYGNEAEIAEAARAGRTITVIGANAAMLDVLRLLQSVLPEDRIDMQVVARSGQGPLPFETESPPRSRSPAIAGPYDSAEAFLAAMDRDLAAAAAVSDAEACALRRGYMALFDAHPLNDFLTDPREARRAATQVERRLVRGTRDSVHDLRRLRAAGRVRFVHGAVEDVTVSGGRAGLVLRGPNGVRQDCAADLAVNCAGPGPAKRFEPLAQSLLDRGWIRSCPVSGGIDLGPGMTTETPGLRYASPAVNVIGGRVEAYPLYNGLRLRRLIAAANGAAVTGKMPA